MITLEGSHVNLYRTYQFSSLSLLEIFFEENIQLSSIIWISLEAIDKSENIGCNASLCFCSNLINKMYIKEFPLKFANIQRCGSVRGQIQGRLHKFYLFF